MEFEQLFATVCAQEASNLQQEKRLKQMREYKKEQEEQLQMYRKRQEKRLQKLTAQQKRQQRNAERAARFQKAIMQLQRSYDRKVGTDSRQDGLEVLANTAILHERHGEKSREVLRRVQEVEVDAGRTYTSNLTTPRASPVVVSGDEGNGSDDDLFLDEDLPSLAQLCGRA